MSDQTNHGKTLTVSILSLSLLTVMAGAAVAPALGVIQAHFADTDQLFVQMVISVPALFIVITNFIFPKLCKVFGARTLVLMGLLLYTVGGCAAGLFDNIFAVLVTRALVGIGVGIILPLSTGLLSYYYRPEQQVGLMGYSSAMNQMGGVIATLLSGLLANISWRVSFLVYLMGLISIVLCLFFLPNDRITQEAPAKEGRGKKEASGGAGVFRSNIVYILAMFLLMSAFFIYPANFALETVSEGIIPQNYIAVIMAGMDFIAFCGGLPDRVSAAGSAGRLGRYPFGLHLCGLCQRCGHPLHHVGGVHEGGQGGGHHSDAADLCGPVPGTVCVANADVRCDSHLRRDSRPSALFLCYCAVRPLCALVRADTEWKIGVKSLSFPGLMMYNKAIKAGG